ncbi:uncharacterized protein LOC126159875 [Schistocerca cancellata]|uniref:uncharacterized protein LOC126159875 n=1 Tax=Schistocerca cancellata TaxID=274614 RepID=UPI00211766EB|nr:uncharacterized protein LOC126159875 [Schistocerca cancellata]
MGAERSLICQGDVRASRCPAAELDAVREPRPAVCPRRGAAWRMSASERRAAPPRDRLAAVSRSSPHTSPPLRLKPSAHGPRCPLPGSPGSLARGAGAAAARPPVPPACPVPRRAPQRKALGSRWVFI